MARPSRFQIGTLLILCLFGCSSGDEQPNESTDPSTAVDGGDATEDCNGRSPSASRPCTTDPDPCNLNSGFEGDEYCLLPPPPGEGIQIHFGPKSYSDQAELAKYTIEPGEEFNAYGIAHIPTTEDRWFSRAQIQMRPGSHHLINTVVEGRQEEGFAPNGATCPGATISGFPGTQNLVYESPPNGQFAPENEGLGRKLAGNSSLCLNYHSYNFDQITQLREVWINVWFVDETEVTQRASGIFVTAGPYEGIPPGAEVSLRRTVDIEGDGRIISLFGHRHAWTERFAAWHNDRLIYDSWDWEESVVFNYDSITENPPANPEARTDGAVSGIVEVKAGDQLTIQCDIKNGSDKTLTFKNALYEGEMCILFGGAVGVGITAPFAP